MTNKKTAALHPKQCIIKLLERYVTFWNNHDIVNWGSLFTDDTVFITWSGVKFSTNLENILNHEKAHKVLFEQDQNMTYSLNIQNISFVNIDVALVHADWNWKDFKNEKNESENRMGVLTMLLIRENKTWRIRTTQNTRTDKTPN